MTEPRNYDTDTAVRVTYDTLRDRGYDHHTIASAIDHYDGDLWLDVYGPAVDKAEELLGLARTASGTDNH